MYKPFLNKMVKVWLSEPLLRPNRDTFVARFIDFDEDLLMFENQQGKVFALAAKYIMNIHEL